MEQASYKPWRQLLGQGDGYEEERLTVPLEFGSMRAGRLSRRPQQSKQLCTKREGLERNSEKSWWGRGGGGQEKHALSFGWYWKKEIERKWNVLLFELQLRQVGGLSSSLCLEEVLSATAAGDGLWRRRSTLSL